MPMLLLLLVVVLVCNVVADDDGGCRVALVSENLLVMPTRKIIQHLSKCLIVSSKSTYGSDENLLQSAPDAYSGRREGS